MEKEISFISAGFPSPAEDFIEISISLDKHLISNPPATFMAYAKGNSMIMAGINNGDLLIIDRSLDPKNGDIVIAVINGEFTVKKLSIKKDKIFLVPQNSQYLPIQVLENMDFQIWGIVTYSISKHQ
tara:strand:+ start:534 stop:914 length:381 start_codon:yes stop_codon:yes gene_type:complete